MEESTRIFRLPCAPKERTHVIPLSVRIHARCHTATAGFFGLELVSIGGAFVRETQSGEETVLVVVVSSCVSLCFFVFLCVSLCFCGRREESGEGAVGRGRVERGTTEGERRVVWCVVVVCGVWCGVVWVSEWCLCVRVYGVCGVYEWSVCGVSGCVLACLWCGVSTVCV